MSSSAVHGAVRPVAYGAVRPVACSPNCEDTQRGAYVQAELGHGALCPVAITASLKHVTFPDAEALKFVRETKNISRMGVTLAKLIHSSSLSLSLCLLIP